MFNVRYVVYTKLVDLRPMPIALLLLLLTLIMTSMSEGRCYFPSVGWIKGCDRRHFLPVTITLTLNLTILTPLTLTLRMQNSAGRTENIHHNEDDADLIVVVEVFLVVVDELRDAGSSRGAVAAAERHVVGPIAGPRTNTISDVRVPSVDELVGNPRHAEPVGILAVTAALQVRL